jgi:hypothetical protein
MVQYYNGQRYVKRAKRPTSHRNSVMRPKKATSEPMMLPGDDATVVTRQTTRRRWRPFKFIRCSICTAYIWSRPIALKEPVEAPEPRYEWVLCSYCHKALLNEMRRSSVSSPVRLRIAVGLVAAERSPYTYYMAQQKAFQREFSWFVWALILFTLFHLVIFVILFAVPR